MAVILDGKKIRSRKKTALLQRLASLSRTPKLVIFQVGDRRDSTSYIERKREFGRQLGVAVEVERFASDTSTDRLVSAVAEAGSDAGVDGLIVQLPLPGSLDAFRVLEAVPPLKDVDGLSSVNVKKLFSGRPDAVLPAATRGIISLLRAYDIEMAGRSAVVIGQSFLVGKPTAMKLLAEGATVTVAHDQTVDLSEVVRSADIVVSATGQPGLVTAEFVRPGQTIIDVGISFRDEPADDEPAKKPSGDIDLEAVREIVAAVSPVPGGVGPMTVVSLFENLLDAAEGRITDR